MYLSFNPAAESTELTEFSAVLDEIYQQFDLKPGSVRGITGRAAEEYPIFSNVHEYISSDVNLEFSVYITDEENYLFDGGK